MNRAGMTDDDDRGTIFYRPEEVAKKLEIPRAAVMRLIRRGKLGAIRLTPRLYRVTDKQLAEYKLEP